MEKTCVECGATVHGRSDKRFCSTYCRSTYNNKKNGGETQLVRDINRTLKRNRRILGTLNTKGKTKVKRSKLADLEFNFNYHTNTFTTKAGKVYYFCYDQGYLELDDGYLALVERQEYVQ